jgi:2-methylcitrate dehydratase
MALVAGRLMGLEQEQLANAMALGACYTLELGILHSPQEQLTMARNLRFPFGAHNGALAAILAGKGFKAPLNVFEGHHGIADTVTGNEMDLDSLTAPRKGWSILNTWIKSFAAEGRMHGHIEATIDLVQEHCIRPEDVARVRIWTTNHTYQRMANPKTRRDPATKYTADHSSYYTTAVAIIDHAVGPDQFTEERLSDPRVRELSEKVFVEPDPRLEAYISPGVVEITTTEGAVHRAEVLRPKGHPMNPMTDTDVERKFRSMADKVLGVEGATRVIETVGRLDQLADVSELLRLMVAPDQLATASPTR